VLAQVVMATLATAGPTLTKHCGTLVALAVLDRPLTQLQVVVTEVTEAMGAVVAAAVPV
jgi:hypothetical protein